MTRAAARAAGMKHEASGRGAWSQGRGLRGAALTASGPYEGSTALRGYSRHTASPVAR
eukprot:CAMPEP_0206041180 /NCGR_PEP_ID=MMETSP1466-20131121/5825_1 /ASSEMBLY_ACC=CAM_ASM_001126 /TAXON_ID=44452 /ORGANISM="Pavlova gyrans, Strain CCMP608" /LENGTH=57 /DNA_ID=CAMNT_0053415869 /DNA_START=36 /DNA_END=205 /DNA_ORIENTATION=-